MSGRSVRDRPPLLPVLAAIGTLLVLIRFDTAILRLLLGLDTPALLMDFQVFWSEYTYLICLTLAAGAALLRRDRAMHIVTALLLQAGLVHLLKALIGRVRPIHGGDALLAAGPNLLHTSYPSGHAVLAGVVAFLLARLDRRLLPLSAALILVTCWARLEALAHFPSDLLAGLILGYGCERAGAALARRDGQPLPSRLRCASRTLGFTLPAVMLPMLILLPWRAPTQPMPETDSRETVTALYRRILQREPDGPGLEAYAAELQSDGLVIAVVRSLALSPEFIRRMEAVPVEQRIDSVYSMLLDRPPTAAERARQIETVTTVGDEADGLRLVIRRLTLSEEYLRDPGCFALPGGSP